MTRALGLSCLGLVALVLLVALLPGGHDPRDTDAGPALAPPGSSHRLGTDAIGRDVWARLAGGAWSSLGSAAIAVLVSSLIGVIVGSSAGMSGGRTDRAITALNDGLLAFPRFVLLLTVAATVELRSALTLGLIIGLTSWMRTARIVRTEVLSVRARAYVEAARAAGASSSGLLLRHVAPQISRLVAETARLRVASVVMTAATLNYLGVGLPVDSPSWGGLIRDGRSHLADAPWIALPAVAMLCLTSIGLMLSAGDTRRTE